MNPSSQLEPIELEQYTRAIQHACPNCHHPQLLVFYEVQQVPVHSCLMLSSPQEALDFPCGDIQLGFCPHCGFITNVVFDPHWSAYAPNYEDQQSYSPTFNQFALDLAHHLIDRYDLHHKAIVEIGCSKGDFLFLLCELGPNRGVGIDPSAVPGRVQSSAAERVQFIPAYYARSHAEYMGDFVCCRHTLEHIQPTAEFVGTVRESIGDRLNTGLFFEIPCTTRVLQDLAFEDIYYEHCSYFTPGSLARLFRTSGFAITDLYRAYDNQYLLMEAQPTDTTAAVHPLEESLEQLKRQVQHFTQQIDRKLQHWQRHLDQMQAEGKRVVVWGSGSKCVAFLTTLKAIDKIQYVIDINPHRHGKFIPGVGKEIKSPEFLQDYQPDQVIVMNPIYCDEIRQMLEKLGVTPEVIHL